MSTFKKAKVVMLPTNEKVINTKEYQLLLSNSLFWTSKIEIERYTEGWFFLNNSSKHNSCAITIPNVDIFKHQHLYITSDDEIKEGDWYFDGTDFIHKKSKHNNTLVDGNKQAKKIIATTDTSLLIDTYINQGDTVKGDLIIKRGSDYTTELRGKINLPQPSQQFIQKYIEEYNRGNIITDVLVEYLENYTLEYYESAIENKRLAQKTNIKETLKVNPKDNTITIKKAKDSYTREEVENLIYKAMKNRCYTTVAEWKKWIEENL